MRPATAVLGLGGVLVGIYYLLSPDAQEVFYCAFGLLAAVASASRAWRRADGRPAWICFALAMASGTIADALNGFDTIRNGAAPPIPSADDWFYLASYPFFAAGVLLLLWELGGRTLRIALFDTAIVAIAAALVQWVFFISQYLHTDAGVGSRLVSMAYPSLDVLLLIGILQLVSGPARRSSSYRLVVASLVLQVVGDESYGIWTSSYVGGNWMDAFWLGAYVCWAAAALDPKPVAAGTAERRLQPRLSPWRIAILAIAVMTPRMLMFVQWLRHDTSDAFVIAGFGTVIVGLVLIRVVGLMRAHERARQEERVARKEAERAYQLLAIQNEELKQLDRLKDQFVSGVSHELRTPLTSITGYVDVLRDLHSDPEAQEYLGIVERNAERLLALVDDLLFAARVQAGQLAVDLAPVDLGVVVAEAFAAAKPAADKAGVALHAETATMPPVRADALRLQQVLDNLISNAIKFTPRGGDVTVALSDDGEHAALEVSDTGVGMDDADRSHLFERFYRTRTAQDRQIPGTGLGLHITKAIVEAHGGSISVRSAPGEGSSFRVRLPLP